MSRSSRFAFVRSLLAAAALLAPGEYVHAQTTGEHSTEARFQLDLRVPDAAVQAFLPPGWKLNVATQGNAKDVNLRVVFVDRLTVTGPDGKPVGKGSNRLVYLAAPVTDPTGARAQLVIGGLTADPAEAPGPFGVYLPARTHAQRTSTSNGTTVVDSQDWTFTAETGEQLEMHITFERGPGNKGGPNEVRFYSAKDPRLHQVSRQEQALDVLRNVTTKPRDRVQLFSFKGLGGRYAKLFDGTEQVLSWDNVPWINRSVSVDTSIQSSPR